MEQKKFDAVFIETTGLADPAPVAQTFFADDFLKQHMEIDSILTLVDAKHVEMHLDEEKEEGVVNEAIQQVAFADRILLNKIDLVSDADKQRIKQRIRKMNKFCDIIETEQSKVDLDKVLAIKRFDLAHMMEVDEHFLPKEDKTKGKEHGHGHGHEHEEKGHGHEHGHGKLLFYRLHYPCMPGVAENLSFLRHSYR